MDLLFLIVDKLLFYLLSKKLQLEKNLRREKEDMQKDQTNHSAEKSTEDKVVNIDDIVKELPELLVKHAYTKLKSGEELTASEMKVCLEVFKLIVQIILIRNLKTF